MDKVGSSFAGLAYATIGLFMFLIAIGDFVRLFKYISKKLRPIKVNALKNDAKNKLSKKNDTKINSLDLKKIKEFDERIFYLEIQIRKELQKNGKF